MVRSDHKPDTISGCEGFQSLHAGDWRRRKPLMSIAEASESNHLRATATAQHVLIIGPFRAAEEMERERPAASPAQKSECKNGLGP